MCILKSLEIFGFYVYVTILLHYFYPREKKTYWLCCSLYLEQIHRCFIDPLFLGCSHHALLNLPQVIEFITFFFFFFHWAVFSAIIFGIYSYIPCKTFSSMDLPNFGLCVPIALRYFFFTHSLCSFFLFFFFFIRVLHY